MLGTELPDPYGELKRSDRHYTVRTEVAGHTPEARGNPPNSKSISGMKTLARRRACLNEEVDESNASNHTRRSGSLLSFDVEATTTYSDTNEVLAHG